MRNKKVYCSTLIMIIAGLLYFSVNAYADSGLPVAELKMHNGTPTIFINGEPNAGLTYMTYAPKSRHYEQFGNIGVDLASFQTSANYNLYWFDPPVWISRDSFYYGRLDELMNMVVDANPNVYIFPRVYLFSPPWWDEENPDELMKYNDGSVEKPIGHIRPGTRKVTLPSWSSQKWREDTGLCVRKFIEHVRSQPYGKRVIGYMMAGGGTEEWYYWSRRLDYSKPHLEGFKKWLKKKYGTVSELRRRWNKDNVSFDSVWIPTWEERTTLDLFKFRDPSKSMHVIDFYDYTADITAEAIMYFLRVVKETTNNQNLAGAFYGYLTGSRSLEYAAFHKFLSCPDLDFISAPTSYAWREVGTGFSGWRTVYESIRVHGKLWMDENDYRTHLLPWTARYGRAANYQDSEAAQLRQMANLVTHGAAAWWFDMGSGWYDSPFFLTLIKKLNRIGERSIHFDRSSAAEIAAVVDEKSQCAVEEEGSEMHRKVIFDQNLELGKIGAPFDWLLIDDLELARPYKVYVFLNAYKPREKQKAMIKRLWDRGAKAIVFGYGAGYIGESSIGAEHASSFTGIKIAEKSISGPLRVKMSGLGSKLLPGVETGSIYGIDNTFGPLIYANDSSAEVLGVLQGHGVSGLVSKEIDGVQVYYSAAPMLGSSVLRGIAARAGAHIYYDSGEVVFANNKFFALHTATAGTKHIRLPRVTDVYDVYNDKLIAKNTDNFRVDLPVRHTVLYFLGTEKEWKGE